MIGSVPRLASIPATVSRWKPEEDQVDSEEPLTVWADHTVPQIGIEAQGVAFCRSLSEAEILETAIRVARQSLRRR